MTSGSLEDLPQVPQSTIHGTPRLLLGLLLMGLSGWRRCRLAPQLDQSEEGDQGVDRPRRATGRLLERVEGASSASLTVLSF